MCGIAGIISSDPNNISPGRLRNMTDALAHRGPDGDGQWINPSGKMGLGHRRLAIIDLSDQAAQPMHYLGRYTIIHNGEIYNYTELRDTLKKQGYTFRSQSDTEVILAAYDLYKEGCLQYFDGMYAFAIWDETEQQLFCARDRFGEKPFYYSFEEAHFCFASERKALWAAGIEKKINAPLLLNYLALGLTSTAADNTITFHQDIFSLPPSHYVRIRLADFEFSMHRYWDGDRQTQLDISPEKAAERLNELLLTSVQRRLRSDVPVGTSLSGGLDSSCIVSAIQKLQPFNTGMQTFSAIFPGFEKDESKFISIVNEKFGLPNYQVTPSADDFIKNFEKLCYHQEEPFSSASVYAQYKVFELAKIHGVKVLLDGQGADETLAGYSKYIPWHLQEVWRKKPSSLRQELKALRKHDYTFDWGWKNYLAAWLPLQVPTALQKREIKKIKSQPDITDAFRKEFLDSQSLYKPLVLQLNDMLYYNTFQFGLEELLRIADRNSMAHGREVRLPFLHYELVSFIGSLPGHFKIHGGWTKWILRKAFENQLPGEIVWRTGKIAYEPPQRVWMKGSVLREYIHEAKKKLVQERILNLGVQDNKNQPQDAYAADSYDWRYLVAAAFI